MGVVYRAQDTNLSREVAIKVLPEQFTPDPQRLARFEREAKLLDSLTHRVPDFEFYFFRLRNPNPSRPPGSEIFPNTHDNLPVYPYPS